MAGDRGYTASGKVLQAQQDNSPAAIVKKHHAFLAARLDKIAQWVRAGVRPEALVRFTLMDLQNNEALRRCSAESIYMALLACATTGLEPGALKQEAYLVPFGGVATFVPGWRGLVKMAKRSREVTNIVGNVVHAADDFDIELGTAATVKHRPALQGDRGDVIGAYAFAKLAHGDPEIEWVPRADLDAIEKVATKNGKTSPAYRDWRPQMQRKAAIRRLCKRLPMGNDYYVALAVEEAGNADNPGKAIIDVLDTVSEGAVPRESPTPAPKPGPACDGEHAPPYCESPECWIREDERKQGEA